jgi:hypothetical protein
LLDAEHMQQQHVESVIIGDGQAGASHSVTSWAALAPNTPCWSAGGSSSAGGPRAGTP